MVASLIRQVYELGLQDYCTALASLMDVLTQIESNVRIANLA